jgi:hypothetical protein
MHLRFGPVSPSHAWSGMVRFGHLPRAPVPPCVQYGQQKHMMTTLCYLGWTLPPLLQFRAISVNVCAPAPTPARGNMRSKPC